MNLRYPLLGALAICALLAPAAAARPQMRSIFQDDCLLLQLDADPHCSAQPRGQALDAMRDLGADTIKLNVIADKVRQYGWGAVDEAVEGTLARGMTPYLGLTARGRAPSTRAWVSFVSEAVRRYPRVHLWSFYNEPNLRFWLRSRSPRDYRRLFLSGRDAVTRAPGHRNDRVLLGELAPRATGNKGGATGPLAFTRELFCLDRRLRPYRGAAARRRGCARFRRLTADGFAVHPYTNGRGVARPTFVDPGDGVSVATLGRITPILDAAVRRRRMNRMPLWVTEMAYQSRPPYFLGPPLAAQAEWINQTDRMLFRHPRVASVSQYDLDDVGLGEPAGTGLRFVTGGRKPSWRAYRLPIYVTVAGRGRVRVWGQVRPGGRGRVAVQKQAGGRGRFRNVAVLGTNGSGYFERRFRGGGRDRWRLAWREHTSRIAVVRRR